MATTQSQQSFVAPNFDSGDVKSQAGATSNVASSPQDLITQQVVSAANAHGIVVSSQNVQQSPHQTTLPVNTVTLTVQPTQLQASQVTIQPQIITANVISSEDFQAKEGTAINWNVTHAIPEIKTRIFVRSIPHLNLSFCPIILKKNLFQIS